VLNSIKKLRDELQKRLQNFSEEIGD